MASEPLVTEMRSMLEQALPGAARVCVAPGPQVVDLSRGAVARRIDHTDLRPAATTEDARRACQIALEAGCAAVCLSPRFVALAAQMLRGSDVATCTVVGFPHGTQDPAVKAYEAAYAVRAGAGEVDMVIGLGALRARDAAAVLGEIEGVRQAIGSAVLKVIIETTLLSDAEKVQAAVLSEWAGADFVKTSTGFAGGGATVADVRLLRQAVGGGLRIKASGGIRTAGQAAALLEAGADRLGMSATIAVLADLRPEGTERT